MASALRTFAGEARSYGGAYDEHRKGTDLFVAPAVRAFAGGARSYGGGFVRALLVRELGWLI